MRILFSTDQTYLHGGIEKVMAAKANYFADVLGYEVYILTTEQKSNPPCYPLSEKIVKTDIGIDYFRDRSYFHRSNFAKIPKHFSESRKMIQKIDPDIIICCNYAFDFYWMPFIFTNIPKLKEYHSSRYPVSRARQKASGIKMLKYRINDFIEQRFTKLIILNPDEKPFYHSQNTEVIPNPIDIPQNKAALDAKRAIAAGRIAPVKGFEKLIRAWKIVSAAAPDWRLEIFGQGEAKYIGELDALIRSLDLHGKVNIRAAVPDLSDELLKSSLYLMTSQNECFPMVLLESLSVGLPIVSFDCPTGPRNIVTDNIDGFLAKDQDIDDFAQKVISLANDAKMLEMMGNNAKRSAEKFALATVMEKWVSLFDKLKA